MLLLRITVYGWAMLGALLLSLLLTKGVLRRLHTGERQAGCGSFGFVALVISILMVFVLTFSITLTEHIYGFFSKPRYAATVVSFSSRWEERDEKDSDGRSRKRKVLMHRPTVVFTDSRGQEQRLETDISSGKEPRIGSRRTVVFSPGDAVAMELSFTSISLLFAAGVMVFLMGYLLFAAFRYAQGANMQGIIGFGMGILFRFLIPAAMLVLLCGMLYGLWGYLSGQRPDMPLWAALVCGFFSLVLLLVLPVFLKQAYSPGGKRLKGPGRNKQRDTR